VEFALKTTQLTKTYRNGVTALKGVDLAVPTGDFYALLGPNGAGKSTVISVLGSLVIKTGGRVEVFGVDIDTDFPQAKSFFGRGAPGIQFQYF
jgi:ABC-2 type transport system ATP-binding protein